jgi:GNAT superfamily N-acetyltransferase
MGDVVAFTIRPYRPSDVDGCRACVVELQDAERQIDSRLRRGDTMADEYLRQMHERCRDHAGIILVAEHADAIIGLVMVLTHVPFESLDEPPGHCALVAELVVHAGVRGQGIGRALLHAAERHAHESGATELRIAVLSNNHPARQLYLGEGFEAYSEILAKPLKPSGHRETEQLG